MSRIEIYPKDPDAFYAVCNTEGNQEALEASVNQYSDLYIQRIHGDTFICGVETTLLPKGHYFVVCGPYWDVLSPTELMDDFRIG